MRDASFRAVVQQPKLQPQQGDELLNLLVPLHGLFKANLLRPINQLNFVLGASSCFFAMHGLFSFC